MYVLISSHHFYIYSISITQSQKPKRKQKHFYTVIPNTVDFTVPSLFFLRRYSIVKLLHHLSLHLHQLQRHRQWRDPPVFCFISLLCLNMAHLGTCPAAVSSRFFRAVRRQLSPLVFSLWYFWKEIDAFFYSCSWENNQGLVALNGLGDFWKVFNGLYTTWTQKLKNKRLDPALLVLRLLDLVKRVGIQFGSVFLGTHFLFDLL